MNSEWIVFCLSVVLPIAVVLYGVKSWYRPAQWKKSERGGYHSRRADKTPEHWRFAQYEYARLNLKIGIAWSILGIAQAVVWKRGILSEPVLMAVCIVEFLVYCIIARIWMEKKLSNRFDISDALAGR